MVKDDNDDIDDVDWLIDMKLDDLARELLQTVIQPADLVDANALVYLWPQVFHYFIVITINDDDDGDDNNDDDNVGVYELSNCHLVWICR